MAKDNTLTPDIVGYNPIKTEDGIQNIYPEVLQSPDQSYGYNNQSLDSTVAVRNF